MENEYCSNETVYEYIIKTVNGEVYSYKINIKGVSNIVDYFSKIESEYIEVTDSAKNEIAIKKEYIVSITKLKGWW